jgi:large subunit ribosomal protein L32
VPVPKKRKTSTRGKQGRSHDRLKIINLLKCPKCGDPVVPHTVCLTCGYYRNREILHLETKLDKKLKKEAKKKEAKEGEGTDSD